MHYTDGSFNANARIESIKNNSQGYLEVKTKKNWKRLEKIQPLNYTKTYLSKKFFILVSCIECQVSNFTLKT